MKGLDTEIPKDMKLQAMAVAVLQAVETKGFCLLEVDDGPDSEEAVIQLHKICGNVGYYFFRDGHRIFVISDHQIPRVTSGSLL